jgi:hypothetical protein
MNSVSLEQVVSASTIRAITVSLARICHSWTTRVALMRQQDPQRRRSGSPFSPHLLISSKRAVASTSATRMWEEVASRTSCVAANLLPRL